MKLSLQSIRQTTMKGGKYAEKSVKRKLSAKDTFVPSKKKMLSCSLTDWRLHSSRFAFFATTKVSTSILLFSEGPAFFSVSILTQDSNICRRTTFILSKRRYDAGSIFFYKLKSFFVKLGSFICGMQISSWRFKSNLTPILSILLHERLIGRKWVKRSAIDSV